MLDNSGINNLYLKIVTLIINIKQISKEFVNKNLILNLEIVKFCNQEIPAGSLVNRIVEDGKATRVKEDLPRRESSIVESLPDDSQAPNRVREDINVSKPESFSLDTFKSSIAEKSREVYPRLRSIILNSTIRIEGNNLVIEVNFEMNYLFLSKGEVRSYILESVKGFNQNIESVAVVLLAKSEDEELEGVEPTGETPAVNIAEDVKAEEKQKEIDNSELIEVSI